MDILIKNMEMPSEGRIINLTICSDGSVINNLPDAGGKMSSYRSERVKAVALPEHGDLIDRDTLIKDSWASYMLKKKNDDSSRVQYDTLMGYEIRRLLEDAPTIVEANYGSDY